jgi:hypothetical protein
MVNNFYIVHLLGPPLWSSGQIFCEVVGLERGPLSLVMITEELLERKVAATVKKTEINRHEDSFH